MNINTLGVDGEMLVCAYVKQNGMEILERNYRFGKEEIDIIARDGDTIAFIEVKSRTSVQFGRPEEAVTRTKQRTIAKVALAYIRQHRLFNSRVRFDVAAVLNGQIKYIKYAFDTTGMFE